MKTVHTRNKTLNVALTAPTERGKLIDMSLAIKIDRSQPTSGQTPGLTVSAILYFPHECSNVAPREHVFLLPLLY